MSAETQPGLTLVSGKEWVTRVKRCPDCHGTGVTGHTRFGDGFETVFCRSCLGNGQVLYTVRQDKAVAPLAGARS